MNIKRLSFLSFGFLFVFTALATAQSVRAVAYFPVPYLTHKTISANTAYFALADGVKVEVAGTLNTTDLQTKRDLEIVNSAADAFTIAQLNIGDMGQESASDSNLSGEFLADSASGSSITLGKVTSAKEIKADNTLNLKSVKWGTNTGFKKSSYSSSTAPVTNGLPILTDGFPSDTKKFCWSPLRLKGTYEYNYYLIAYTENSDCPGYGNN